MGKALFIRNGNGRGLKPTTVADELAHSLAYHVDAIELIFDQSRATSGDIEGTIHIGGPKEFIHAKMIPLFASLSQHNIKTALQVSSPEKIYALMQDNILDLAITEQIITKPEIGHRKIHQCELILVSSPKWGDTLNGDTVTPRTLEKIPLIVFEEAFTYIHQYYADVFKEEYHLRPTTTVEDLSIIRNLLRQGAGYSVLPKCLVEEDLQQGHLKQLIAPSQPPQNTIYLLWNKYSMRKSRNIMARDAILKEAEKW